MSAIVVRDICFVPKKGKKGQEGLRLSVTTVRTYDETKEDVQRGEFPGDTLEEQLATLLVNLFIGKLEIEEYSEKTLEGVKFYLMDMRDIVSEAIYTSPEKDCKYGLTRYTGMLYVVARWTAAAYISTVVRGDYKPVKTQPISEQVKEFDRESRRMYEKAQNKSPKTFSIKKALGTVIPGAIVLCDEHGKVFIANKKNYDNEGNLDDSDGSAIRVVGDRYETYVPDMMNEIAMGRRHVGKLLRCSEYNVTVEKNEVSIGDGVHMVYAKKRREQQSPDCDVYEVHAHKRSHGKTEAKPVETMRVSRGAPADEVIEHLYTYMSVVFWPNYVFCGGGTYTEKRIPEQKMHSFLRTKVDKIVKYIVGLCDMDADKAHDMDPSDKKDIVDVRQGALKEYYEEALNAYWTFADAEMMSPKDQEDWYYVIDTTYIDGKATINALYYKGENWVEKIQT